MKEMIVCFACILAMLAFILPGVVADSALNATNVSAISNETENISLNATENASSNATENVSLNATENTTETVVKNATEIVTPSVAENATAEPEASEAPENITQTAAAESTENKTESAAPTITETHAANPVGNSQNNTKVLRAGFEKTKALNNLDVYGNKSVHALGDNSGASESAFNASQRMGNVSKFNYNTSNTKLYNVSEYSRTKPMYQVPSSSSSKPVYDIEKYSTIKAPASIP